MTKTQQKRIIRVIKSDASLHGEYHNPKTGDACVIGGLALDAKYRGLKRIREEANANSLQQAEYCPILAALIDFISKVYGLTKRQQFTLQSINDTYGGPGYANPEGYTEERRKALIKKVLSWKPTSRKQTKNKGQ